ncbi:MAG: c-type cytochrome domain-containing protein, partial [Pirellulaceae bacterium]
EYCVDCHRGQQPAAGFAIDELTSQVISQQSDAWEMIVRKLRTRQMPPPDADRPSAADYHRAVQGIERVLD